MSHYLYGASVQGIQDFIFKTNKLQEIVGASEIVKKIAEKFTKKYAPDEILINAAGNIKAIFSTKEACEEVVLNFPKIIQQQAFGITLSQAVVELKNSSHSQDDINALEKKLKIQRNKPSIPLDLSLNIMHLHPSTAKASIGNNSDKATSQKITAYKSIEQNERFKDLQNLSNKKNKIAVIHIDGNGLGQLIPHLKKKCNLTLSEFSKKLDMVTKEAFEKAKKDKKVREIILGGDDVTVICDADDALSFTQEFLQHFEVLSEKHFSKLSACAGIAYSNEKYPFHYAVDLAEALCKVAKDHSKREYSALMFHNIQSSNYITWEKFVEDELTIKNKNDKKSIRCDFGAYYLNKKDEPSIKNFLNTIEAYRCDASPISRLRNWLRELYKSDKNAELLLERINTIVKDKDEWNCKIMDKNLHYFSKELSSSNLIIKKDGEDKTPIYDVLQILSATEVKK